jgi:hypothetical protein
MIPNSELPIFIFYLIFGGAFLCSLCRKIGEQTKAQAVVLFGSHTRNQAGMHSNVDLLVIAESDLPRHKP